MSPLYDLTSIDYCKTSDNIVVGTLPLIIHKEPSIVLYGTDITDKIR